MPELISSNTDWQLTGKLSVATISTDTRKHSEESYQLLQVPSTNLHITLVFIQACRELLGIHFTTPRAPSVVLVAFVVALAGEGVVGLLLLSWGAGSATEHSSDCVADGGADCYTAVVLSAD